MKPEIRERYVSIVESYVLCLDPIKRKRKIPVREIIGGILIILEDGMGWRSVAAKPLGRILRPLRPSIGSYQINTAADMKSGTAYPVGGFGFASNEIRTLRRSRGARSATHAEKTK